VVRSIPESRANCRSRSAAEQGHQPRPDLDSGERVSRVGHDPEGLVGYARTNHDTHLTLPEASRFSSIFFETYPGLKLWHDTERPGRVDVRTLRNRRRIGVTDLTEKISTLGQGSAADGLKAAIALLWERRPDCPRAVPILYTHDGVVVEVPECDADSAAEWLKQAMLDGMMPLTDPVPVVVDLSVERTWAGN
jgi:DNA polymerase-1